MNFKTNAKCGGCVARIGKELNKIMTEDQWSFNLAAPTKTLQVTSDLPAETIIKAVTNAGYKAEQID